jgi:hypothetical protein
MDGERTITTMTTLARLLQEDERWERAKVELSEARAALAWCRANGNPHKEQGK